MAPLSGKLAKIVENASNSAADKRLYHRIDLALQVRYRLPDGSEARGETVNISAGGAFIAGPTQAVAKDKILVYIEKVGRFEAEVLRIEENGFAIALKTRRARAMRTTDTLTWIINGGEENFNRRRAARVRQNKPATVIREDGKKQPCRILDISTTGASLFLKPMPPVGETLIVGRMKARVVRHHEKGIGVVFATQADNSGNRTE